MTLDEILEQSPDIPGYGGGKWAMYSVFCCWWTSFPDDLGSTGDFFVERNGKFTIYVNNKPQEVNAETLASLSCCPHCGGLLMQAPLEDFLKSAADKSDHYGPNGLETLVRAHSRNAETCYTSWAFYDMEVK